MFGRKFSRIIFRFLFTLVIAYLALGSKLVTGALFLFPILILISAFYAMIEHCGKLLQGIYSEALSLNDVILDRETRSIMVDFVNQDKRIDQRFNGTKHIISAIFNQPVWLNSHEHLLQKYMVFQKRVHQTWVLGALVFLIGVLLIEAHTGSLNFFQ